MPILDQLDIDEKTLMEWRQFIGPKANYYVGAWIKVKEGQLFGFNIYAFVFNIFWLLYRQMFKAVVLTLSIFFAMSFLEKILVVYLSIEGLPGAWIYIKILLFALALGYSGNLIYLRHTENYISRIKMQYPEEDQVRMLKIRGGVSFIPVFLFTIILLLSVLINLVQPEMRLNFNTFIR